MRRLLPTLAAVAALLGGCSDNPGQPSGNRPPETGLVFIGDLDTTLYRQEVRWWGSDSDGEVVGFYYRWAPASPQAGFDTSWAFTTDVRDTFLLPTPGDFSEYTFFVQSVDDRGVVDPTPASQAYPFRNAAPTCSLTTVRAPSFPDTLFPSFTLRWVAYDPDGDETIARFLLWRSGNEANPVVIEDGTARSGALSPRDFAPEGGPTTIYLQAVDSGQRGCPPDSFTAIMLPIGERVLLVDDLPAFQSAAGSSPDPRFARFADFFYATDLDTFYGPGATSILDLELYPIGTEAQAAGLLDAYESIIWYDTMSDSLSSPALALVRDLLPAWIRAGGKFLLVSTYAIGTNRLRCNFQINRCDTVPEAFFPGMDPRFRRVTAGVDRVSYNGFPIRGSYAVEGNSALGLANLQFLGSFSNVSFDVFDPTGEAVPLYTLPVGTVLGEGDTLRTVGTVGVLRESGAGRFVLVGFPYSRMRVLENDFVEFRKVLSILEGTTTP